MPPSFDWSVQSERDVRGAVMSSEMKLTKRRIDASGLPAKGEVLDLWDSEIKGFHLRVSPTGRKTFRFWYRHGGRQRVATIGPLSHLLTAEMARLRARELAAALVHGLDPLAEEEALARAAEEARRRQITLNQLIDIYLEQGPALNPTKRARSWENDIATLRNHVAPLLGKLLVTDVRRADVEGMVAAVVSGKTARDVKLGPRARRIVRGGPTAARAAAVALTTLYNWAIRRELVSSNPAKGVQKPPAGKSERFLSNEEGARLLDVISEMEREGALHPTFGDTLRLLALTGCRRKEIERLKWAEIDFRRGVMLLSTDRSKTGSKTGMKTIPLSATALAILTARPRDSAYVFPSLRGQDRPANALSKNWQKVRARAGLKDVRVHDLRHTLASLLVARGASLPIIGKVLGHASAQTTARYAHLLADPLGELVGAATSQMHRTSDYTSAETVGERITRPHLHSGKGGEVLPLRRPGK